MSGYKRSKVSFDKDDYYESRSTPPVKRSKTQGRYDSTDFEIDHEESLEPAKQRRNAVAKDVYVSDDEEVGGGVFSSDSDDAGDSDIDASNRNKTNGKQQGGIEDEEDIDMFSSTVADDSVPDKSSIKGRKKRLGMDDIEGQELGSRDQESDEDEDGEGAKPEDINVDGISKTKGSKLTAFNMRQEMEEGSFDAQGNYIRNDKDPESFHDKWMEGISRKEIAKAKDAQLKRDQAEQLKEASRQSSLPQTQTDIYRALVEYLLPGESVREALTTLGKSQGKLPLWKQKLLAKKNKNKKIPEQETVIDEQQAAERQRKVEEITGLADQLMALGHFSVYDDTFEVMVRHLRNKGEVDIDWMPQSTQRKE